MNGWFMAGELLAVGIVRVGRFFLFSLIGELCTLTLVAFLYRGGALSGGVAWPSMLALGLIAGVRLTRSLPWQNIRLRIRYRHEPRHYRAFLRYIDAGWPALASSAGLAVGRGEESRIPGLAKLTVSDSGQVLLTPSLLWGQTIEDLEAATEPLRVALDALTCRVVPDETRNSAHYALSFHDHLAEGFNRAPDDHERNTQAGIYLGATEDGEDWLLPRAVSTITAGATGSGKGSVMWGIVLGHAPGIADGTVRVLGIDLKGGMELTVGAPLFATLATDPATAVDLLEEAARDCQARAKSLAGSTRQHQAAKEAPTVLVVIDELASLVAYLPERDLMKRAEAALAILLTQGRAVGFYVYGFLQDPRKEVLKLRSLFPQSIALRLKEKDEASMVLSAGAVAAGARCHQIPRTQQGTGYVLDELGRVVRVRAAYCSDVLLRESAKRWAAPSEPVAESFAQEAA